MSGMARPHKGNKASGPRKLEPRVAHSIDCDQADIPRRLTEIKAAFQWRIIVMHGKTVLRRAFMNVGDIMTQEVLSVGPETTVKEAAAIMLKERVSGLPVINSAHVLLGIVTEGDFLRRAEVGTERKRPHWMEFIVGANILASEYVQSHARAVRDVMTHNVAVATEDMPLDQAVNLMERRGVKRLPVVRDGRVVGIVARADLLHALVANSPQARLEAADRSIGEQVRRELAQHPWKARRLRVLVKDGVVDLWGYITHEHYRDAIRLAAQNVPGVKHVRDHLAWFEPYTGIVVDTGPEARTDMLH